MYVPMTQAVEAWQKAVADHEAARHERNAAIKRALENGVSVPDAAEAFGLSLVMVYKIRSGEVA